MVPNKYLRTKLSCATVASTIIATARRSAMTATAFTTKLPTGTWQLDTVHSSVGFEVPYLIGTFKGQFSEATATLQVGEDGSAELQGETPVSSIRVQDENLNGHLLSPE